MVQDGQSKRTLGNVCAQLLLSACVLLVPPLLMVVGVMHLGSSPEDAGQQVKAEVADKRTELTASFAPAAEQHPVISERPSVAEGPAASTRKQVVKDTTRYEGPVIAGDGSEQSPTIDVRNPQTAVVADLSSKVPEQLPADKRRSPARPAAPYLPDTVAAIEEAQPASRPNESGNWVVQLSAQRTEEEAQAAFRAAQAKYATLTGHQVLIRKKDQGGRGVFYAAQVGPLTRDEANGLCNRIKNSGGSCFIQAN
jgi:SPOR domain